MRPDLSPEPDLDVSVGDGTSLDAPVPGTLPDAERRVRARSALSLMAGTLYRWKVFIVAVTLAMAVGAIVVSGMLTPWYASTTRVLPPESGDAGGLGSLIGELSPLASSFIGGGGDYSRYLAILNSYSLQQATVERFDLVRVYGTNKGPDPVGDAAAKLSANTLIEIDLEYNSLMVTVFDTSPERAAEIANFMIAELNRRNEELALQGAGRFREYVEGRYRQIELRMDSARAEMQAFQERHGVVELPTMAQGLAEATAASQARIAEAEIQYEALVAQLGPENPQTQTARSALEAARRAQADLLGGREAVMPIARQRLPAVASEYARLYQELLVQQALMENARPLVEQARFDEERDRVAVQVLDPAIPATRKARPRRAVLVVTSTLAAGALACLFALAFTAVRLRRREIAGFFAPPAPADGQ